MKMQINTNYTLKYTGHKVMRKFSFTSGYMVAITKDKGQGKL